MFLTLLSRRRRWELDHSGLGEVCEGAYSPALVLAVAPNFNLAARRAAKSFLIA